MNLNSKYFDRIRISPDAATVEPSDAKPCEWQGCGRQSGYRAPKGRRHEGEYFNFCLDHVRDYNRTYNYFAGMTDNDVAAYQRSASTGHRPTWTMGIDRPNGSTASAGGNAWSAAFSDPIGIFGDRFGRHAPEAETTRRPLKNLERRSFTVLDLDGGENDAEIKARYKSLVKLLHPDANGGDRSSEDRLRRIIQAYHYLKSAGFC